MSILKQKLIDKILEDSHSTEELAEILKIDVWQAVEDACATKLSSMTDEQLIDLL